MPEFSMVAGGALSTDERGGGRRTEELERSMPSLKLNLVGDDLRTSGLLRPAAEKFAGAWLACFLVMARGDILGAFSAEHMLLASICGTVGAVVTVALLVQMDRTVDSVTRQATISAVAT